MDRMMQQAVPHARLVDVAWLWIGNLECLVCAVPIRLRGEIAMECDDVGHQVAFEFLHVLARFFPARKFLPRVENIFG